MSKTTPLFLQTPPARCREHFSSASPVFADGKTSAMWGTETADAKYEVGEKLLFGIGVPMNKASGWSVVMEAAEERQSERRCASSGSTGSMAAMARATGHEDLAQATDLGT